MGLTPLESPVFSVTSVHWPNVVLKKGPLAQLQSEARTLAGLAHPNIVPVVGIVKTAEVLEDGQPAAYLAMKRQAASLESRMKTTRSVLPPPPPHVLHLSLQLSLHFHHALCCFIMCGLLLMEQSFILQIMTLSKLKEVC